MGSKQKSMSVTEPVFSELSKLRIRIALSNDNRIPTVSDMLAAMLTVGNKHYDEILIALTVHPGRVIP